MNIRYLSFLFVFEIWIMTASLQAQEASKLNAFFKNYLEEEFRYSPTYASAMGDHRFDALLGDFSPETLNANLQRWKTTLNHLRKEIDFSKLDRPSQIDLEIFEQELKLRIWTAENVRPYETDPRVWNTIISDSVFTMLTQTTEAKERTILNAAKRIQYIPQVLQQAQQNLKNPPKAYVETAIRQNKGAIQFYKKGIYELTGETPQVSVLSKPCQSAVIALEKYQEYLEKELLPKADGEWRLGKTRFAEKFVMELDVQKSADTVLQEAESEAIRVQTEMYVIARQLWSKLFPKQAVLVDDPSGRRETIRKVLAELGKSHGTSESMLSDTKATVKKIKDFIQQKDLLRLPAIDQCEIIEMPEFQRGNSTAYLNPAPPLDTKAKSFYALSPPPKDWDSRRVQSYFEEYNSAMLQILTIHEAYPGHYVQLEYGNRHPSLIRKIFSSGIFAEGWAVYTEQMMLDEGYGENDLSMRLHQLKWYLRAVTNAILDHKMHCQNLSDEDALKILVEGAFQTEGEALGKIIRSKQSSCQLSTYFVGRMAFYQLRQAIQREQGETFDLGRFHEAVLDNGTLPVKYLPEVTRQRLKLPR